MRVRSKKITGIIVAAAFLLVPIGVSAETDDTVINATIDSTISISTSGSVAISVMPVTGGAQSSASDTVTVSTNDIDGYTLTLEDADDDTNLINADSDEIAAHTATEDAPSALANNSWGYAVVDAPNGSFDGSYSSFSNQTGHASKWAGVPADGSANVLKSTNDTAAGDVTTVWYSVKADPSNPNGVYTDTVVYTATVN